MVGSLGKKEGKVGDYFEKKGKDSSRNGGDDFVGMRRIL